MVVSLFSLQGTIGSPANSDPRIIVVGAISKNGSRALFSNYGSQLDVVAPGEYVTSTTVGSGYAYTLYPISGTSFAAPQVSAVAALLLSKNPNLTGRGVAEIIEKTARKVGGYSYTYTSARPNWTWNNEMGHGLIDAYVAVSEASLLASLPPPATPVLFNIGTMLNPYQQGMAGIPADVMGYWVQPGVNMVTINQNYDSGASYEWDSGVLTSGHDTGPHTLRVIAPAPFHAGGHGIYEIKCRAYKNGQYSEWDAIYLYVSTTPPPTSPSWFQNEAETETTEEETEGTEELGVLAETVR
jgi:hypothetical protein